MRRKLALASRERLLGGVCYTDKVFVGSLSFYSQPKKGA